MYHQHYPGSASNVIRLLEVPGSRLSREEGPGWDATARGVHGYDDNRYPGYPGTGVPVPGYRVHDNFRGPWYKSYQGTRGSPTQGIPRSQERYPGKPPKKTLSAAQKKFCQTKLCFLTDKTLSKNRHFVSRPAHAARKWAGDSKRHGFEL